MLNLSSINMQSIDEQETTYDQIFSTPLESLPLTQFNHDNAYRPRTLTPFNMERLSLLPLYPPSTIFSTNDTLADRLLLTNVPENQLSTLQSVRRTPNMFLLPFDIVENNSSTLNTTAHSFMILIHQQLLTKLSDKWKIDISILDYNLARLIQTLQLCVNHMKDTNLTTNSLSIEELEIALEYYLQIDVDLFYMKTRIDDRQTSLFCKDSLHIKYTMHPCGKSFCNCCRQRKPRHSDYEDAIEFHSQETHEFVHGYQTILNGPATCETSNMIYALKCPCKRYDYVGYSNMTFRDCLTVHRRESNRILREFLIGPRATICVSNGIKSIEQLNNDRSSLYTHLCQCSATIQLFLDAHREFWCLVPMTITEATASIQMNTTRMSIQSMQADIQADAKFMLETLPKPPSGFLFSQQQKRDQFKFFTTKIHKLRSWQDDDDIDLFNASIIATLPKKSSMLLQKFIVALFITHADCPLNESGSLLNDSKHNLPSSKEVWCANLRRRPIPTHRS